MQEVLLNTLKVMGWLGVILGIILVINTVCGIIDSVWGEGEAFSAKKLLKGIIKSVVFYGSAVLFSIAATLLPFVNQMVIDIFGTELIATEVLNTLSSVAVIGIVSGAVVVKAKDALANIIALSGVSTDSTEEITWTVTDDEE